MDDLIAKLEAAEGGCRELDANIAEGLGNPVLRPDVNGLRYVMWPPDDDTYTIEVPHYTTSLDAKLPWENIVNVGVHDVVEGEPLGEVWEAWHLDPETRRRTMGSGYTEPIARRVASLKSRK